MTKRYLVNSGLKIRVNRTTNFVMSMRRFEAGANYVIVVAQREIERASAGDEVTGSADGMAEGGEVKLLPA